MTEESDNSEELRLIRTCFVAKPDGDVIAAFAIDGRRYTDAHVARQIYEEARGEMSRRWAAWEWETHTSTPNEPYSKLPSWEEYRMSLDETHPLPRFNS
ncbi:hypothetical protein [Streptomyces sp. NPDC048639]|uniref:hypothetical protein n=1 Tax=Streptomyces sp. NPDC048639 TaxID=3365581 RepID=UPI003713630D